MLITDSFFIGIADRAKVLLDTYGFVLRTCYSFGFTIVCFLFRLDSRVRFESSAFPACAG